ncbi:MerR family transcriptional regulator [Lactobacillus sp. ESL0701]|uniref:MerR family transcriptional regulator n=1 Tax=Lactobacillus sp. ESL0701 TaxID=2983217 RepID=UPI0023F9A9EF|nr:MerR family transcriptional regulator [Lactobacillus sp. ESL0701]MDF7672771.1 MerR family transcriptional regulator [Lactobacillus sp. ESL0701]
MKQETYAEWLNQIIKPDKIYLSIRDAARASDVSDTQVRYWIKMGYLKTTKAENGAIKLPFNQIAKIRMIKFFLNEGYTLPAAAKKMTEYQKNVHSLLHLFLGSIHDIKQENDQTIFDLGPLATNPKQHIYGIESQEDIKFVLKEKN